MVYQERYAVYNVCTLYILCIHSACSSIMYMFAFCIVLNGCIYI